MNNHFGKGLMVGLKATHADSAVNVTKFGDAANLLI